MPPKSASRLRKRANNDQKDVRVGALSAAFIISIAAMFDGLQVLLSFLHVIPVAGNAVAFVGTSFIGILAPMVTAFCFALCGVVFFSGKRAGTKVLTMFGPAVAEIIPLINGLLPAATAGAVSMFIISRIEDAERRKKQEALERQGRTIDARYQAQPTPEEREPQGEDGESEETTRQERGAARSAQPKKRSVESRPWERPEAPIPEFRPPERGFE